MKIRMTALLVCVVTQGYSQKLKKLTVKSKTEASKEVFYVLKSDHSIRHGEYKKLYRGKVIAKGSYNNDQRSGIWEFYGFRQELVQQFDFSTHQVIHDASWTKEALAAFAHDTSLVAIPAAYLGGMAQVYRLITSHLRYPSEARIRGVQGKVFLRLEIGPEGRVVGRTVIEGIGYGCDQEALRIVGMVPDHWIPAKDKQGRPTSTVLILPISFRLA